MSTNIESILARFEAIRLRVDRAASRSDRDPDEILLVVVTKGHALEVVKAAAQAGIKILGESYAEEGAAKIQAINRADIEWHMIGHIQSRKARIVAENYDLVHSLDSVKLARRLNAALDPSKLLPVLIQVNVSGEDAKFGVPAWETQQWDTVDDFIQQMQAYERLEIRGLMTVPPFLTPEEVRPYFGRMRTLRDFLQKRNPDIQLHELSMGMSNDFEVAIEEGATIVRVGTAIMGPRTYQTT